MLQWRTSADKKTLRLENRIIEGLPPVFGFHTESLTSWVKPVVQSVRNIGVDVDKDLYLTQLIEWASWKTNTNGPAGRSICHPL